MREIDTDVVIHAPPEQVWEALTDLSGYAAWNPFIVEASGRAREGERIRIRIRFEKRGAMEIRPVILKSEAPRELVWKGRLFVGGLFDGEHRFSLEPTSGGGTRLRHSERFTGVLIPILWSGMEGPTRKGFEEMNLALKTRAETGGPR